MRKIGLLLAVLGLATPLSAQTPGSSQGWLSALTTPKDYVLKRSSSYDRTGGNEDSRRVAPGETLTLMDEPEDRFRDRKSTRLNSSHVRISYAVFCLKK